MTEFLNFNNSLTKLNNFTNLLIVQSKLGLFDSVNHLYDYHFSKSSLRNVLIDSISEPELFTKSFSLLRDYLINELKSILANDSLLSDNSQVNNFLGLFRLSNEIKATFEEKSFSSLLNENSALIELVQEFFQKCKSLAKSSALKHKLTLKGLLDHLKQNEVQNLSKNNILFLEKVNKMFEDFSKKLFSFTLIKEIATEEVDQPLQISNEIFNKSAECLVMACQEVDIRICQHYCDVFKRLFMLVVNQDDAMRYVYNLKYFKNVPGHVPNLCDYYRDFDNDLTLILNSITEFNTFNKNPNFGFIQRRLAFLLTISPKPAIRPILLMCIRSKPLVSSVVSLLQQIPAFFELRCCSLAFGSMKKELLILMLFRHFLNVEETINLADEKESDALSSNFAIFTRTQFSALPLIANCLRTIVKKPLFDATELLRDLIIQHIEKNVHLKFMLRLLDRMLQINSNRYWEINWSANDNSDVPVVNPTYLIILLIEKFCKNYKNKELQPLFPKLFCSLGIKLKADKIVLSQPELVLNELNILHWNFKYCICNWLAFSIDQQAFKLEIPEVLFKALALTDRSKFLPIVTSSENSETEDFIRSIFELAVVSHIDAEEFLQNEICFVPIKVFPAMLSDAILRSTQIYTTESTISNLKGVLQKLITLLDVPVKTVFCNQWSECTFVGMQKLSWILVLFDAIRIAINENLKDKPLFDEKDLTVEAKILLRVFCTNVLNFIYKEFDEIKAKEIVFKTEEFGTLTEARLVSALNQLTVLISHVRYLVTKFNQTPQQLRNLKHEINQTFKIFQRKVFYLPLEKPINRKNIEKNDLIEKNSGSGVNVNEQFSNENQLKKNRSHKKNKNGKSFYATEHSNETSRSEGLLLTNRNEDENPKELITSEETPKEDLSAKHKSNNSKNKNFRSYDKKDMFSFRKNNRNNSGHTDTENQYNNKSTSLDKQQLCEQINFPPNPKDLTSPIVLNAQ